ncbi:hypothetical protein [Croceicoccus sp. BE223]|uniref:hypothetical protein n=1 Tax=Croceicoccus sp. BE223 TaxID=2817716 RepID=UPI002857AD2E|nr:hypothetical protein [Croceicoccus sp. BE223]MDR7102310.1 hypothetical protein [Croceicoccus sp. BE223]
MDKGDDKQAAAPLSDRSGGKPAVAETREERLARQLRENLRRRKAQARALRTLPDGGQSG